MHMTRSLYLMSALIAATAARGGAEMELTVKLKVPDAAWTIVIDEVRRVDDELWMVSTVSRDPDRMGAQVISTVRASVKLAAPELPVKHFIIGKTWKWENEEPYTFIRSRNQIGNALDAGTLLYRRSEKTNGQGPGLKS